MLGLMIGLAGPAMAANRGYVEVSTWNDLQEQINYPTSGGSTAKVQLSKDLEGLTYLYIPSGKTLNLNLNGHTLSHKGTGTSDDTVVFIVYSGGRLDITGNGKITGGRGLTGGGIYVNGGTVVMNGGTIENNYASDKGGGVYIDNGGTFALRKGSINNNTANGNGGGVYVKNGTFYFSSYSTIQGNTAGQGGGVYVGANGSFYMTDGSLTSNKANQGGGIYAETKIGLYGSSTISDNTTEDIYLKNAQIDTGTSFNPSKAVSVTLDSGTGDITNGEINYSDATAKNAFSSENAAYEVYSNGGQAALRTPVTPVTPTAYTVRLIGGAHAVSSGNTDQTITAGESMQDVTYTANDGYHFEAFSDITNNGITVKRQTETSVTVSGTPTSDVTITIPNAVPDGSDPTPGGDDTPISATITFKVVNGAWNDGTTADKTFVLRGTSGNPPKLKAAQIPSVGSRPNTDYKAGHWDVVPDTDAAVTKDMTFTYSYAHKDSITRTVTFKVINGAWDDTTTADEIITLVGSEGAALKLSEDQIPDVGHQPAKGYKAGSWDTVPSTQTPITADTTYTYTYAKDDEQQEEKPAVTNVTPTSITIKVGPDEEASIDDGNTWVRPKDGETNITFDNLEPGKEYHILIRKITAEGEDPSPVTETLDAKTPAVGQVTAQVIIGDGLPNVTIDGFDDTLAAKLCTTEDQAAMENGQPILFTLKVNKQDNLPAEDKALCDELAAKIGQSAAFSLDMSVEKKVGDAEAVKVTDLNGNAITVSFDLPNELTQVPANTQRTFYFIRVHNGQAEQLPTTLAGSRLSFQTDKFSTYALAYQDTAAQSGGTSQTTNGTNQSAATTTNSKTTANRSAKTGVEGSNNLHIALAIAGLALTIGFVGFALRRNKARQ